MKKQLYMNSNDAAEPKKKNDGSSDFDRETIQSTKDALNESMVLTDSEVETYLKWLSGYPMESRGEGVSITIEFLPGFGERIVAKLSNSECVLRDYF